MNCDTCGGYVDDSGAVKELRAKLHDTTQQLAKSYRLITAFQEETHEARFALREALRALGEVRR